MELAYCHRLSNAYLKSDKVTKPCSNHRQLLIVSPRPYPKIARFCRCIAQPPCRPLRMTRLPPPLLQDELYSWPPSPAAASLAEALQNTASKVGAVHLALHSAPCGLISGWQQHIMALVEPSPDADALARDIVKSNRMREEHCQDTKSQAGASGDADPADPQSSCTLGALCAAASRFELLDGSVMTLLTKQEVAAGSGHRVTSYMFQRLAPSSFLTADQLSSMVGKWQQQVVVCSGWMPPQLTAALLSSGVKAVVAADSWGRRPFQESRVFVSFFQEFYRVLVAGRPVLASIEAAENAYPELRGYFHLWCMN